MKHTKHPELYLYITIYALYIPIYIIYITMILYTKLKKGASLRIGVPRYVY